MRRTVLALLTVVMVLGLALGSVALAFTPPGQAGKSEMLPPGLQGKGVPPGLAKKGGLPPGLHGRDWLPPGIRMRFSGETDGWDREWKETETARVGSGTELKNALKNTRIGLIILKSNITDLEGYVTIDRSVVIDGAGRSINRGFKIDFASAGQETTIKNLSFASGAREGIAVVERCKRGKVTVHNVRFRLDSITDHYGFTSDTGAEGMELVIRNSLFEGYYGVVVKLARNGKLNVRDNVFKTSYGLYLEADKDNPGITIKSNEFKGYIAGIEFANTGEAFKSGEAASLSTSLRNGNSFEENGGTKVIVGDR